MANLSLAFGLHGVELVETTLAKELSGIYIFYTASCIPMNSMPLNLCSKFTENMPIQPPPCVVYVILCLVFRSLKKFSR